MTQEQFKNLITNWMPDWDEVEFKYAHLIKPTTLQTLHDYLFAGIPMGGFLQAVMRNDLFEAVGRADSANLASLRWIIQLIYNEFPGASRNYGEWLGLHHDMSDEMSKM